MRGTVGRVLLAGLLLLQPVLAMAEGTMEEGWMRDDFEGSCAACHGSVAEFPLKGVELSYETSGHRNNGNSWYANGAGCQKCHTNEGFIDFVKTGKVDTQGYVAYPSQPGCATCHTYHESFDFTLRTSAPVKLVSGDTFDLGAGNLCANCHQSRAVARTTVKATAAKDLRSTWGAHHGPQADVVNGVNAWEFPGKSYSSSPHKAIVSDGCVTCHMALPEGRYSNSPEIGGHSFNVVGEVHEAGRINVAGCIGCHAEVKQVAGTEYFSITAKADYDRDGRVEPIQAEVQGLLDAFVNERGTGYLQTIDPPMYRKDAKAVFEDVGAWAGSTSGQWSEGQVGALFNYKMILEDRSLGVHNTTYIIQVLYDSLKALDPGLNDSLRPR